MNVHLYSHDDDGKFMSLVSTVTIPPNTVLPAIIALGQRVFMVHSTRTYWEVRHGGISDREWQEHYLDVAYTVSE